MNFKIRKRIINFIARLRKFYLYNFNKAYLVKQAGLRKGYCKECGQCCGGCLYLRTSKTSSICSVYSNRPRWCNKDFPIDNKDLVSTGRNRFCGYYWENK